MMNCFQDVRVLVLGLGDSGLSMARWCARHGARVAWWDSREQPPGAAALAQEHPQVERLAALPSAHAQEGDARADDDGALPFLGGFRWILKSPGLAPHDARIAPLLQAARDSGIPVQGELDLFARALADLKADRGYAPQVLAVTGTNGKTTTTALTALLVARTGRSMAAAGNIGPALLDTLAAALDAADAVAAAERDEASAAVDAAQTPAAAARAPAETVAADAAQTPAAASATPDEAIEADASEVAEEAADAEAGAADAAEPAEAAEAAEAAEPAGASRALEAVRAVGASHPGNSALPQVWVLELSSFQLEGGGFGVRGFDPAAAAVLNITQDHIDWHGGMPAYRAAKARVFGGSGTLVINRDDPLVDELSAVALPPPPPKGKVQRLPSRPVVRFGLDAPRQPGDFGLVVESGMAWLVRALPEEPGERRRKGDPEPEIHLQRLMPADALRIRGRHNAANALAALALATAIGCPLAPMLHGLREYTGEPHRVQPVGMVGEVEAYDDSKGTNVGATVAALLGLGADKAPGKLVVVLGGDGKGQDFAPLAAPLARHARAVATIGRDAAAIEAVLTAEASSIPFLRHDTLPAAVAWCFDQALPGDAVLLSPACASLDMFANYAHRAEVFVQAVQALAHERGQA